MVAVGEGAQAASYQGHGAEAGAGLAGCVGAGGVLFAVLAVTRGLQPVVRARKGHLHGCLAKAARGCKTNKALFVSLRYLKCFFLSVELKFCPCCSYVKLKVSGPGQFCCLVLLNLIWKSQAGMDGSRRRISS